MSETIDYLLETNKPLHPVELEQAGLTYMCGFGSLELLLEEERKRKRDK